MFDEKTGVYLPAPWKRRIEVEGLFVRPDGMLYVAAQGMSFHTHLYRVVASSVFILIVETPLAVYVCRRTH